MSAELESGVGCREVIAIGDNDVVVAGNLDDEFGLGSPADGIRRDRHHSSLTRSNALGRPSDPTPANAPPRRPGRVGRQRFRKGTNHSANPALTGTLTAVVDTPPTDAVTSSAVGGKISKKPVNVSSLAVFDKR